MVERLATKELMTSDLAQFMGPSRLFPFVEYHSLNTVRIVDDEFSGDTLDSNRYTVANGGGNNAASPVVVAGVLNGIARLVTGDAGNSTASSEISTGLQMRGDRGCVMVACLTIDIISGVKIEVGFTDVLNDAGAVNVKATPSFNATDCALWIIDTTNNANWEGLAANNQDTLPATTLAAGISPVAATYEWLMVELVETDDVNTECAVYFRRFAQNGVLTFEDVTGGIEDSRAQGPNANVLLTPWIYVEARNSTSKSLDVDYLGAWQKRVATQ